MNQDNHKPWVWALNVHHWSPFFTFSISIQDSAIYGQFETQLDKKKYIIIINNNNIITVMIEAPSNLVGEAFFVSSPLNPI